jgi:hypothetical protein
VRARPGGVVSVFVCVRLCVHVSVFLHSVQASTPRPFFFTPTDPYTHTHTNKQTPTPTPTPTHKPTPTPTLTPTLAHPHPHPHPHLHPHPHPPTHPPNHPPTHPHSLTHSPPQHTHTHKQRHPGAWEERSTLGAAAAPEARPSRCPRQTPPLSRSTVASASPVLPAVAGVVCMCGWE